MATKSPGIVLPGQLLGPAKSNNIGEGTHITSSNIYASIAGPLQSTLPTRTSKTPTLSITRKTGPLLPESGTIVIGKITRTNPRQATLSILALGSNGTHVFREALPGIIRQQDIRATEIDKVKVNECFRVGDVVRAVVISLGDERSYYMSTAKNELGVVMAWSAVGNVMVPVSWKEFADETTGDRESRKAAKPV
jgi:exosome complex component CSL4